MYSFACIPIIALCCYSFLLVSFLAAQKNKLIRSFINFLVIMIAWTSGSLFMRMLFWPSVHFWFNISLFGLFLVPIGLYDFIRVFLGEKKTFWDRITTICLLLIFGFNLLTDSLIPTPQLIRGTENQVQFIYEFSWLVLIPLFFGIMPIIQGARLIYNHGKQNPAALQKLQPILIGIAFMVLGHVCLMASIFKGFPVDIFSGIINAGFLFYAMYKKRLFKLTLLTSRGNCYLLALAIVSTLFYQLIQPMNSLLQRGFHLDEIQRVIALSVLIALATLGTYWFIKHFFDEVFVKEELMQSELLHEFNSKVSKTLNIHNILDELIKIVQKTLHSKDVFICLANDNGDFVMTQSNSPFSQRIFKLAKDHPLLDCLEASEGCLLMSDFCRTTQYRSMWEREKQQLNSWHIECVAYLKEEDSIIGLILLTGKEKKKSYNHADLSFLMSVCSVSSIVVKNSKLYEKAYEEARKDELTGLLNRKCFFEVLDECYSAYKSTALSLLILNIDDFKLYNQLYGDKEGDVALQGIARIIKATAGTDSYVARYSGKEFAVLLPNFDLYMTKNLAENIAAQIRDMNHNSKEYALKILTVSCGICAIPYSASTPHELVNNADMAVYHVKRSGKNAVMIYSEGHQQKVDMESPLMQRNKNAYSEYAPTIYALTAAIDTKDHYTFSHSKNVAYYSVALAKAYGMNDDCLNTIREAGLLHDIGKIGIPEEILNKPGKLTNVEYEIMKGHVEHSLGIIRHLPSLDYVIPAVLGHHERYDGRGYPRRISGEDIPLMARMLCIADSFDAMISVRSYKSSMPVSRALEILVEESGKQFDPKLVPVFVKLVESGEIEIPA